MTSSECIDKSLNSIVGIMQTGLKIQKAFITARENSTVEELQGEAADFEENILSCFNELQRGIEKIAYLMGA